jgi:hypothetical protein
MEDVEEETPVWGAHFSCTHHWELVEMHEHTIDLWGRERFTVADQKVEAS